MYMLYMYEPGKHRTCSISLQVRISNTCTVTVSRWICKSWRFIRIFDDFCRKKHKCWDINSPSTSSTVLFSSNTHKHCCATKPFNRHPAEVLPEERSPRSSLRSSISSTASAARQAFPGSVFDLIAVTVLSSCACPCNQLKQPVQAHCHSEIPEINEKNSKKVDNP